MGFFCCCCFGFFVLGFFLVGWFWVFFVGVFLGGGGWGGDLMLFGFLIIEMAGAFRALFNNLLLQCI